MDIDRVHIVLASNRRYLPGLRATAASLLNASADKHRLLFHVLSDGLSDEDRKEFSEFCGRFGYAGTVDYRNPDLGRFEGRFPTYNGSHTANLRLLFPEVLMDLDWVIWSDVDVLWFRDPARLWAQRDDCVSLLWCRDFRLTQLKKRDLFRTFIPDYDERTYACSGVVMMNLKRMRDTGFCRRFEEFIPRLRNPAHPDQDFLNLLCYGDAKIVDSGWDCLEPCTNLADGIVIHFVSVGPQFGKPYAHWHPSYEIWFRYYEQVVLGHPGAQVAPLWKRMVFTAFGLWYTPLWACRVLAVLTFGRIDARNIHRPLYFCWLRRKLRW